MSRHRLVRKLNIQEELESDDDADYLGRSSEDDNLYETYSRNHESFKPTSNNNEKSFLNLTELCNSNKNKNEMNLKNKKLKNANTNKNEAEYSNNKSTSVPLIQTPKKTQNCIITEAPTIENLSISEIKLDKSDLKLPQKVPLNSSIQQRLLPIEIALAAKCNLKHCVKPKSFEPPINLVIVGHVDAGKSTIIGHLLYFLGNVDNKTMHKNQQDSARAGKSTFEFAWILDESEEERARGITMDIGRITFYSKKRTYHILDAPGHKDFIPNMIKGASQADAALLVINATKGEFETGFNEGGQTREHVLLLRSMGISKLIVAINKMDTIEWSQNRFNEIIDSLKLFLYKQAGFDNVKFIPLSGYFGLNLVESPPINHPLTVWYKNDLTLIEALDNLQAPNGLEDKPLRIIVNDIIKLTENTVNLIGKIEAGFIETGEKLFLMPDANSVTIKSVILDDLSNNHKFSKTQQQQTNIAYAGDHILLIANGSFEPDSIFPGYVLCRGGSDLLVPINYFSARILVFDIRIPIIKGICVELFTHSLRVSCTIFHLISIINNSTRKIIKKNPRVLTKHMSAMIEIKTDLPINIEPHPKTLCRFTLRRNNQTIAAGIVENAL